MRSEDNKDAASDASKVTARTIYLAIVGCLFESSMVSLSVLFALSAVAMGLICLLGSLLEYRVDTLAEIFIGSLTLSFMALFMYLVVILMGAVLSLPLVLVGAAGCMLLRKYKVDGLPQLILAGASLAGLYGELLKKSELLKIFPSPNDLDLAGPNYNGDDKIIFFNIIFPIVGALTSFVAYPKLKQETIPQSSFLSAFKSNQIIGRQNDSNKIEKNPAWLYVALALFVLPLIALTLMSIYLALRK